MMKSKIILRILLLISFVAMIGTFIYITGGFNKQTTEFSAAYPFITIAIVFNCLCFIWTFAKKSKPNAFMYGVLLITVFINILIPSYRINTLTVGGTHSSMNDAIEETKSKNLYGFSSIIK